tara:strand:- start:33 stop:773 length:741 start_codon:yes stop_codon:yes gene_type:complete
MKNFNFETDILPSKELHKNSTPNSQGVIEYLKIKEGGYPTPFDHNRCQSISPIRQGWLEYKLSQQELQYVWERIKNKKQNNSNELAGNAIDSYVLSDENNWFFLNTLCPLMDIYGNTYANLGNQVPVVKPYPYFLARWWVNFQKQNTFNPLHFHDGVYSFVIWMKIPIEFRDQNKDNSTNTPRKSAFCFRFTDMMGMIQSYTYQLGKGDEATLLFFPSKLQHTVYPFYNCDEDRITVSGNISLDDR